jgi:hypothetical protein
MTRLTLATLVVLVLAGCSTPPGGTQGSTPTPAPATPAPTVAAPTPTAGPTSVAIGPCGQVPAGGEAEAIPWGGYSTGAMPLTTVVENVEAAGLEDVAQAFKDHNYHVAADQTVEVTWCFVAGDWAQYWRNNGQNHSIGATGTYSVAGDTIELREPGLGGSRVTFAVDGDQLTLSDFTPLSPDPDPWSDYVRAMFESAPYTRLRA